MMNKSTKSIVKNSIIATFGLMLFALGSYTTIQANIGVDPWNAFALGLSKQLGIMYGTSSIAISFFIIICDLLLKEKIGLGTILDAIVVGKTVDLLNWIDLIPKSNSLPLSIGMMLIAFFIMGFAQYLYMQAQLCCGPRDAFLVALGKRIKVVPIGVVNIGLLLVVLFIGYILGGPIGIGTVIAPIGIGLMQQLAFNMMKFDPTILVHQNIIESARIIFKKK